MKDLYPDESVKLDVLGHLEELRRRLLICIFFILVASAAAFANGRILMELLRGPSRGVIEEMIFIGPSEAFTSYLKLSMLSGVVIAFPAVLYNFWAFLSPALEARTRKRLIRWMVFSAFLFFAGVSFSYFIALPAALKFLVGFSSGMASAYISLGKYMSFFGALIISGGLAFELPVFMAVLVDVGFMETSLLRKKRQYAFLFIMIIAAILTPTQDIFNMLLFALPMLALYELGILIGRAIETARRPG